MCIGLHVKYPLFLSCFTETSISWPDLRKPSNIIFHENHQVGAELFHADGRTDMTKSIVAFRYFANAPKNCLCVKRRLNC
jgi:hypothetical protein